MIKERNIYKNGLHYLVNMALFPVKMIIPQPIISKMPYLETNLAIRTKLVLGQVKGKLLDIGCGENILVKAYRQKGGEGIGADVYDWGAVDVLVDDTSKLPLEDESVDVITFVACLNHIPNRIEVLKNARRLLRKNGYVLITNITPFISRIWHLWAFWDHDQHERGMIEGEVFGFTDVELREIISDSGYKVVETAGFSWGLNTLYVLKPL